MVVSERLGRLGNPLLAFRRKGHRTNDKTNNSMQYILWIIWGVCYRRIKLNVSVKPLVGVTLLCLHRKVCASEPQIDPSEKQSCPRVNRVLVQNNPRICCSWIPNSYFFVARDHCTAWLGCNSLRSYIPFHTLRSISTAVIRLWSNEGEIDQKESFLFEVLGEWLTHPTVEDVDTSLRRGTYSFVLRRCMSAEVVRLDNQSPCGGLMRSSLP